MPVKKITGNSSLRIIGGQWRGRKLSFQAAKGLRPTANRVRETLFNWLSPMIRGAHCLDAFCGSGALGLEALSRGAAHVTFADNQHVTIQQLKLNLDTLAAENYTLIQDDVLTCTPNTGPFNLVFLDPPFKQQLLEKALHRLEEKHLLKPNALIYCEAEYALAIPKLDSRWTWYRQKKAGQVYYGLLQQAANQ